MLTPPRDPHGLGRAISTLLGNRAEAARFGAAGRELVLRLCTDEVRASRVEELYHELLAERAAR